MYERDVTNEEKILTRLISIEELLRKLLDVDLQGLENQRYNRKIMEENKLIGFKILPEFESKKENDT